MRVLFFNYEYPPLGGGAGNANLFLLHEFSKSEDVEVDLVTSSFDNSYHLDQVNERIKIHRLPIGKDEQGVHFQTTKDLLLYSWKAFWFSRKLMKKNKYDLTHSFFSVPCGALSWFFYLEKHIPYIISLRGSDVPGYSERFESVYKLIKPLIKDIWKRAAFVVANSQGLKDLALETSPNKEIEIIANGVDTKKFNPDNFSHLEGDKRRENFKILCGTRVTPRKGFRYLIEAVDQMRKGGDRVSLDIIGKGNERGELEGLVKEKGLERDIHFLGVIDHDEIPKYFYEADVFVSPSLNEGMANAMLEALAMGLPIVATDIGGTKELVEDGKNGFVIKKRDVQDIVDKVRKIKQDQQLREKMSQESLLRAKKMDWGTVAVEYVNVYRKTANVNKK